MSEMSCSDPEDLWPREARCRICREPAVRRVVNDLLRWRGAPVILDNGQTRQVTYSDILRDLEPINEGRGEMEQITYYSLWNHDRRHYDLAAVAAALFGADG